MSASIFFGWKLFQLNWWKSFVPGVIFLWVLRCFASCWSTMWKMGWGLSQLCCPAQLYSPQCNGGKLFSKEIFFCEMYGQAHFSKSSAWVAGKLAIYVSWKFNHGLENLWLFNLSLGSFQKANCNLVSTSQLSPISSLVLVALRSNLKICETFLNSIVKFGKK